MDHAEHVWLLREGVTASGGIWADLGAGGGAFTLALAELIGPTGQIYAIDTNKNALRTLERAMHERFPAVTLHTMVADFTRSLALPALDGVVMANSLHFQRDQAPVLRRVRDSLRPGARLLMVEYNTERGNYWVPYPHDFARWTALIDANGFGGTRMLARRPSRFMGEIISLASDAR